MDKEKQLSLETKKVDWLLKYAGKFKVIEDRTIEARWIRLAQSKVPYIRKYARDFLVNHNLRLIIKEARKYQGRGVPLEDLINEGIHGFLYGLDKFDLSTGYKLSTYTYWWIRQNIGRLVENISRIARIPTNKLTDINRLNGEYYKFIVDHNRPPSSKELAEALGWTVVYVEELGRLVFPHVSLDQCVGGDEDSVPLIDYLEDHNSTSPETLAEVEIDKEYVNQALEELSLEDRRFVKILFGFIDNKQRNDKEMASHFGITVNEVKKRKEEIFEILKTKIDPRRVNCFE